MKNKKRIRKQVIISKLAEELGTTKTAAKKYFDTVFETVAKLLEEEAKKHIKAEGDNVSVSTPLGIVKVVKTKAREGVNPQDPSQKIKIPARLKVKMAKKLS
jgi:nucleoid DNA-binding protein